MKVKKLIQILGGIFIASGIIFLLIHSFIVTGRQDETFSRDLFGFIIPHPPLWTSYIPYLGGFLGIIFELFSIHGFVGLSISGLLLYIGGFLIVIGERKEDEKNKQKETNKIISNPYLPDVIKQEFIKRAKNRKGEY